MVQPLQPLIKSAEVRSFEHTPGGSVQFVHGDEHDLGTVTVAISASPPVRRVAARPSIVTRAVRCSSSAKGAVSTPWAASTSSRKRAT